MSNGKKQDIELNHYYTVPTAYQQDDGISIVDIYRVLAKNKMLITAITSLFALVGSFYAMPINHLPEKTTG